MKRVTRNEVDFSELFEFAEEISGVSWNNANDLFFDEGMVPYKGHRDFYRDEIKADLEEEDSNLIPPTEVDNKQGRAFWKNASTLAYQIIYQYMLKHKRKEIRVFGD